MGGVLIWLAVLVPFFIFSQLSVASFSVLVIALGCALIGFADDWMKIIKGRSLGLSARWKMLLQLGLGLLAGFIALHFAGLTTSVSIPFSHAQWQLGTVGFYILVFLVIASASNTVNLTDGLDGLAAGSVAIVLLATPASPSSSAVTCPIPACSTFPSCRPASSAPVSAFSGSTRSRPT